MMIRSPTQGAWLPAHRETPTRRRNPSGKIVWEARCTNPDGDRRSYGRFKKKGPCSERGRDDCCAQHRIDAKYAEWDRPAQRADTVSAFAETWTDRYPRSERTDATNLFRVRCLFDVDLDGRKFRDWPLVELRRRHAALLVDHMLREQGRAVTGVRNILGSLSAMAEDAITDEIIGANPFKGIKLRATDRRATKTKREVRVWTLEQMHQFAAAAGSFEAMIRMLSDCGLRIGEVFALQRAKQDLKAGVFCVEGTGWRGQLVPSSREKNHDRSGPIPPGCLQLLRDMPARIDTEWLFSTPGSRRVGNVGRDLPGGLMWRYENWYRQVWRPAKDATGMDPTPHEFRHSWNSHLLAAGIDRADLADIAGHSEQVNAAIYTHALRRSHDQIRSVIG